MDTNTLNYRTQELNEVRLNLDRTYKPTIVLQSTGGKTKYLSISWEEFERIAAVLTGADIHPELIAAAPELLEALQEMLERAEQAGWHPTNSNMRKARAAIARATGQVQS